MSTSHINVGSVAGNGLRARVHSVVTARVHGRVAVATAVVRVVAGLVFALTSITKFPIAGSAYEHEMAQFVRFGFPHSTTIVVLVGLLELVGGLTLVAGFGTRVAAFGLAVDMAVAVATAGVRVGGPIHLGLAPTLLVAMVFLLWAGGGSLALDNRIVAHR